MHHHVLAEVGWNVHQVGDDVHGAAVIVPALHVPGRAMLRTSMLAAWADHAMGLLAARVTTPLVPVTLELDVQLYGPAPGAGEIRARARLLKAGRSVLAASIEFAHGDDVIAEGAGSFMLARDPSARLPAVLSLDEPELQARLTAPIAQRAGCVRRSPGVVLLPRMEDGINSTNTIHGGLLALAAEEALLSLDPATTLCSLGLRYLRPLRHGPAVARARMRNGLGLVELSDEGDGNRLAVMATARTFGATYNH
jgi:acyl-coenzyme A thioesterase PaaI-like protein